MAVDDGQTLTAGGGNIAALEGIRDGALCVVMQDDGIVKEVWNYLVKLLQGNLRSNPLGFVTRHLQWVLVRRGGVHYRVTSKSACFPRAYSCRHPSGRRYRSRGIPDGYRQ